MSTASRESVWEVCFDAARRILRQRDDLLVDGDPDGLAMLAAAAEFVHGLAAVDPALNPTPTYEMMVAKDTLMSAMRRWAGKGGQK